MSEIDAFYAHDGKISLFLTHSDLDHLKRTEQYPYGLRFRARDCENFVIDETHPRAKQLAMEYSNEPAMIRFYESRSRYGIRATLPTHRTYLFANLEQLNGAGVYWDHYASKVYITKDHPNYDELCEKFLSDEQRLIWEQWYPHSPCEVEYRDKRAFDNYLNGLYLGELSRPKAGPNPLMTEKYWTKMAWSFFKDLAVMGAIHNKTPQSRLCELIYGELKYCQVFVEWDTVRKLCGAWRSDIAQLATRIMVTNVNDKIPRKRRRRTNSLEALRSFLGGKGHVQQQKSITDASSSSGCSDEESDLVR